MKEFFTYATPESQGLSSKDILAFSRDLEHFGMFLHSFAVIKGNNVVAEMYRKPFHKYDLHRMYSCTKSFVSMAVGLLADEGKIDLAQPILSYFPEFEKEEMYPYIKEATVRDLLTMTTPYSYSTTYSARKPGYLQDNWIGTFFDTDTNHAAGTVFNYDTSASYTLNVLVEKITGMPFIEYLKDKALRETGFSENARVLKSPDGYSWGGSALLATTLDLARMARLVMLDGKWDEKQLLPAWYVKDAKSCLIDNDETGYRDIIHGNGYGYQIWCTGDGTFSFLGMGNQLAICMPEEDLLFVCTADSQGWGDGRTVIYLKLWEYIKRRFSSSPLPEDKEAQEELKYELEHKEYPIVSGDASNERAAKIDGKRFVLADNRMGISDLTFFFGEDGVGTMRFTNAQGEKEIRFGLGKTVIGEFPQDGYSGESIGKWDGDYYRCIASGAWTGKDTLRIKVDAIDKYFGNVNMRFGFNDKGEIGLKFDSHAEWFMGEYNGFAGGHMA